jgi:hypothetical protein
MMVAFMLGNTALADAHPADEFQPLDFPAYDRLMGDSNWNSGELKFYSPDERPSFSQLNNIEKYMVAGGIDPETGIAHTAWRKQMLTTAREYYLKFGEIPSELSVENLQALSGNPDIEQFYLSMCENPIQNRATKLQEQEFSPGDMYIKVLSKEEMIYLSYISPYFKKIFGLNIDANPEMGGEETVMPDINGPVLYYRVYGEQEVLMSGIFYYRSLY